MSALSNATASAVVNTLLEIPALDDTFGAIFLATCVGLVLYGLGLHQTYRYTRLYPDDPWLLKTLVILIVILESIHSGMNMHTCYFYLVTNYFNPAILPKRGVWSISFLPLCGSSIMVVSQIFFARRVFLIGPNYRYIVGIASIFLAGTFAFGTAGAVEANIVDSFEEFYGHTWLISGCFGMAASADVLLTGALIIVLRQSRTGFKHTDSMIDLLIIYAINTGMLVGISNTLSLILAAALPRNLIYVGSSIITAKLYGNCFLAVLNSRKRLAARGLDIFDTNSMNMHALANVHRMEVLEQWNVPQPAELELPPIIMVKVTTETIGGLTEGRDGSHADSTEVDKGYAPSA